MPIPKRQILKKSRTNSESLRSSWIDYPSQKAHGGWCYFVRPPCTHYLFAARCWNLFGEVKEFPTQPLTAAVTEIHIFSVDSTVTARANRIAVAAEKNKDFCYWQGNSVQHRRNTACLTPHLSCCFHRHGEVPAERHVGFHRCKSETMPKLKNRNRYNCCPVFRNPGSPLPTCGPFLLERYPYFSDGSVLFCRKRT